MTKLKQLNNKRRIESQAKKGVEMVENVCGCLAEEKERYWVVRIPLQEVRLPNGSSGTMVLVVIQCNWCRKIIDGRTEVHQKQQPLITLPGGLT